MTISRTADRLLALVALLVLGCGEDAAREGATRLFIDTDLPTPEVASRLRIDLYRTDGTWFDSRDVDTATPTAFPVSFDLAAPRDGATEIRVRLRVYPAGAVRAYRGERFAEYESVFGAPPEPTDELPRLVSGGVDRTPETEPLPALTVDRIVTLRAEPARQTNVSVVLHGACAGVMADLVTFSSCAAAPKSRAPLAAPGDVPGPTRSHDLRETCAGFDPGAGRTCVPGGVFVLGDRTAQLVEDDEGFFLDMRIERLVRVRRFVIDTQEITVGRYRALAAAGFRPSRYSPRDHDGALGDDPLLPTACTYSEEKGDREDHPLNCLPWGSFRQLCRHAGGDLPTEAQWEYVASLAGGERERRYPWGDDEPSCDRAVYGRVGSVQADDCGQSSLPDVTTPRGDATPLGVRDLGGSLSEFILDGPAAYDGATWLAQPFDGPRADQPVSEKAAVTDKERFLVRGGSWVSPANTLRTTFRSQGPAASTFYGARCVYPQGP